MAKYPKIGDRIALSYHGKARVGTVESKQGRKGLTLEHFDTKTGRQYSSFLYNKVDGNNGSDTGITTL